MGAIGLQRFGDTTVVTRALAQNLDIVIIYIKGNGGLPLPPQSDLLWACKKKKLISAVGLFKKHFDLGLVA